MSRAGRTSAKCEGCAKQDIRGRWQGDTPKPQPFRKVGELCRECAGVMKAGREAIAAGRQRRDRVPFLRPWAPHSLPYVRHGGDAGRAFQRAAWELLRHLAAAPATGQRPDYSDSNDQLEALGLRDRASVACQWTESEDGVRWIDPQALDLFAACYRAASALGEAAYQDGQHAGSRLLAGLADGSVSLAKLNEYEARQSVQHQVDPS